MDTFSSLTASEARQNFYSLIKDVAKGLRSYEIRLRGSDPVVILNKEELESWLETFEVLSDQKLVRDLKESLKDQKKGKVYPLEEVEKELKLR